jgi:predicted lipoprotein with Yx(FWY)xxD motif
LAATEPDRRRFRCEFVARKIIVDSRGRTLYLFEKDKRRSACAGTCATYWRGDARRGPIAGRV